MTGCLRCRLLCLLGMALLAFQLAGCGTPGTGGSADPVTESDESPARKLARIRTELAGGYFEQGRTQIALDEIKQALTSDPGFAPAYNLRGLVYMRMNDPRQAEDSLRRAIAIDGRDPDARHNLGWLLCQQNRPDESAAAFRQALAAPGYTGQGKTYMAMGLCESRAGRPQEAERHLLRAYEIDAGNPVTAYNLARMLMERGEPARARFYIRRLNNSDLANAESLWLGIRIEKRLGDTLAMSQLADQLIRRYPQSRERVAFDKGIFDE